MPEREREYLIMTWGGEEIYTGKREGERQRAKWMLLHIRTNSRVKKSSPLSLYYMRRGEKQLEGG